MTKQKNLEDLLEELAFKTPIKEIQPDTHEVLTDLLATEKEYRKQYKIKRLLRMSGIRQVK